MNGGNAEEPHQRQQVEGREAAVGPEKAGKRHNGRATAPYHNPSLRSRQRLSIILQ